MSFIIFFKKVLKSLLYEENEQTSKNRIISRHIDKSLMTHKVPPLFVSPVVTNTKNDFSLFCGSLCIIELLRPPAVQYNKLEPVTLLHHQCFRAFQSNILPFFSISLCGVFLFCFFLK